MPKTSEKIKIIKFIVENAITQIDFMQHFQLGATLLNIERSTDWSYERTNNWGRNYPQCNGKMQSPINLVNPNILPLVPIEFINYDIPLAGNVTLENNGHTVEIDVPATINGMKASISGGLLKSVYEAYQVHLHWGSDSTQGSEHTINGHRFDGEMHIVHKNTKYETLELAIENPDGLAVLGVFFQITKANITSYPGLDAIFNGLPNLVECNSTVTIQNQISLGQLLGDVNTKKFYTFIGSLTTPPCAEAVTWTIFPEPLLISNKQIVKFFPIKDFKGKTLNNNFRPLQKPNNRPIYSNA